MATGAEEIGTWGMRAFLEEYGDELRGRSIINMDNVGRGRCTGSPRRAWPVATGGPSAHESIAKRVAREDEMHVKGRAYKGLSTDATPALARGFKAMSVMAFDINGRLPNWHWSTDTTENVQSRTSSTAASSCRDDPRSSSPARPASSLGVAHLAGDCVASPTKRSCVEGERRSQRSCSPARPEHRQHERRLLQRDDDEGEDDEAEVEQARAGLGEAALGE